MTAEERSAERLKRKARRLKKAELSLAERNRRLEKAERLALIKRIAGERNA